MRFLVLVALLAACETTTTTSTRRVVTLGYDRPPSIVIVTRGDADAAEIWVRNLRADKAVTVVGELQSAKVEPLRSEARFLCSTVRTSFPEQHVDEIIVLDAVQASWPNERCLRSVCDPRPLFPKNDNPPNCRCVRWEYQKFVTSYTAVVSAIRASTCLVVATQELPTTTGESNAHPPIAFSIDTDVAQVRNTDQADSQRAAFAALSRTVETHRWQLFPAFDATVHAIDKHTFEVVDPQKQLASGQTYWIKRPVGSMRATAHVTKVDSTTATMRTTGKPIEPRDEIHQTTEVRRMMLYGGLSGGTVRAQNARHGTAAAALATRITFKVLPMLFEVRLDGDLVPGLDTARWAAAGAGGFRYQLGPIAPVVFAELGLAKAYQTGGGTAFGFQTGLGAGAELSLGRWVLLADVRYRRLYLDEWESKEMPTEVPNPYLTWTSTTLQLGVGALF
ncbi:MAG: hypothetical protein H0T89_34710 [Deltaproteobacteria bacterium]|nr:hypothetical protein [Deltaproteobacteria bacterium]MDQ3298017.1 hypothetical protein [Myxococcota bacterium]